MQFKWVDNRGALVVRILFMLAAGLFLYSDWEIFPRGLNSGYSCQSGQKILGRNAKYLWQQIKPAQ